MEWTRTSHNPLTRRVDLEVVEHLVRGELRWTVREPWSLSTFQLNEHEHFIFCQLTHSWNMESVCAAFDERFAPLRLTETKLFSYLHLLHREGLLISQHGGQGEVLGERDASQRSRLRWAALANPLALRIPGPNLAGGLQLLADSLRVLFRPTAAVLALIGMFFTLLAVVVSRDVWSSEVGDMVARGRGTNWLALLLVIGATKVIHELGHAVSLHAQGGRCRDVGLMFLVFAPCLYCDVSDAWLFPNKWQRIFVSLAGIVVELILASLAFWLWWLTPVGTVHDTALLVAVVCSVNTLLLNGNPLMRYDGYFVLSDWSERPNLAGQSRLEWQRLVRGDWKTIDRFSLAYGFASFVYRILIFSVIFVGMYKYLETYRLELLAVGLIAWIAIGSMSLNWKPGRGRARLYFAGVFAALAVLCCVPLPSSIEAPAIVQPTLLEDLVAPDAGWIILACAYGEPIKSGETILKLRDPQLEKEIAALDSQVTRQRAIVDTLNKVQSIGELGTETELATAESRLLSLTNQLRLKRLQEQELDLVANRSGMVLPPERRADSPNERGVDWLSRSKDPPLSRSRRASYLRRGDVIGRFASSGSWEALVCIPESARSRVYVGMPTRLRLRSNSAHVLTGQIIELAELSKLAHLPEALSIQDRESTGAAAYVATVRIEKSPDMTLHVGTARAQFRLPATSIATRLHRWWNATFYFGG
jgi:putative peptide zinc metalloprotease protein